jgi:hypothetical protein
VTIKVKSFSETIKGTAHKSEEGHVVAFTGLVTPAVRMRAARNGWRLNLSARVAIAPTQKEAQILAALMA